jgi:hypothetical protein
VRVDRGRTSLRRYGCLGQAVCIAEGDVEQRTASAGAAGGAPVENFVSGPDGVSGLTPIADAPLPRLARVEAQPSLSRRAGRSHAVNSPVVCSITRGRSGVPSDSCLTVGMCGTKRCGLAAGPRSAVVGGDWLWSIRSDRLQRNVTAEAG